MCVTFGISIVVQTIFNTSLLSIWFQATAQSASPLSFLHHLSILPRNFWDGTSTLSHLNKSPCSFSIHIVVVRTQFLQLEQ
jgi:hypothetical protein